MQHHDCSISRPQFYDNHMKCIHVSTDGLTMPKWGCSRLCISKGRTVLCSIALRHCYKQHSENFNLVYNMYYLAILTQFNCYHLRIQVNSYKKTDPKYPNVNGINEFMT